MNNTVLDVKNLCLEFNTLEGCKKVLKGVSLSIKQREKVALVGESGSGKSLMVRSILGLASFPNSKISGQIIFRGKDLLTYTKKQWYGVRGRKITMIFQDPTNALNPTFPIGVQMVDSILASGAYSNKTQCLNALGKALRKLSINDPERILKSYPFQLSGGLNQRVIIAMALLNKPSLLLADEPGAALDVTVQAKTLEMMDKLIREQNTTCLFISHNLGVVRQFAHVVYVMHKGRIVESGSVNALFHNPQHPYTRALLNAVPQINGKDLKPNTFDEKEFYNTPAFHHPCMAGR